MPSPPKGRKRGTTFRIATRYSSLGLRKIRDFPENSEKISGGEKSPKQYEPRSIHPTLAWKRTFGRRFIHLSLSVRGAPLPPCASSRSITRYIHNTRRMPVGRRAIHGQSKHHQFPPPTSSPSDCSSSRAGHLERLHGHGWTLARSLAYLGVGSWTWDSTSGCRRRMLSHFATADPRARRTDPAMRWEKAFVMD